MEDWAEIRRLHRSERMPIRAIARRALPREDADHELGLVMSRQRELEGLIDLSQAV